jgi:hypothetical protein
MFCAFAASRNGDWTGAFSDSRFVDQEFPILV